MAKVYTMNSNFSSPSEPPLTVAPSPEEVQFREEWAAEIRQQIADVFPSIGRVEPSANPREWTIDDVVCLALRAIYGAILWCEEPIYAAAMPTSKLAELFTDSAKEIKAEAIREGVQVAHSSAQTTEQVVNLFLNELNNRMEGDPYDCINIARDRLKRILGESAEALCRALEKKQREAEGNHETA